MAAPKKEELKAIKQAGGKRLAAAKKTVDADNVYSIEEALKLVKSNAKAKFDETIDVAVKLGIDSKQSDQNVRGVVSMPNGVGKDVRVAVFAKDKKADEAKKAGADIVGAEDLIETIKSGKIEFDRCIATPDMMAVVGGVAKVLGPRGLMPNPKLGSVTQDVAEAVKNAKSGQIEFKAEKGGIVHAGIGKASFGEKELAENLKALIKALVGAKPSSSKGIYLRRASLSSTMGPGVRVDISSAA